MLVTSAQHTDGSAAGLKRAVVCSRIDPKG
jgi:hypothetical protein